MDSTSEPKDNTFNEDSEPLGAFSSGARPKMNEICRGRYPPRTVRCGDTQSIGPQADALFPGPTAWLKSSKLTFNGDKCVEAA